MPDFFHVTHEIVKSYSLALGRHVRQAHKRILRTPRTPWHDARPCPQQRRRPQRLRPWWTPSRLR